MLCSYIPGMEVTLSSRLKSLYSVYCKVYPCWDTFWMAFSLWPYFYPRQISWTDMHWQKIMVNAFEYCLFNYGKWKLAIYLMLSLLNWGMKTGQVRVHTAPVPEPKLPIATNTQFWVQITGPVFIPKFKLKSQTWTWTKIKACAWGWIKAPNTFIPIFYTYILKTQIYVCMIFCCGIGY